MTPDLVSSPEEGVTESGEADRPRAPRTPLPRAVTVSMLLVISIVVVFECQVFWREWQVMRQESHAVSDDRTHWLS